MTFVFLCLTSLSMTISTSIHVVKNGIILFFFYSAILIDVTVQPSLISWFPYVMSYAFFLYVFYFPDFTGTQNASLKISLNPFFKFLMKYNIVNFFLLCDNAIYFDL